MLANSNPTNWSEDVLKAVISAYPELAEKDGSVKLMNSDEENNAIFMVNYPSMKLSLTAVINRGKIMPINCGIKEGGIVYINKENKDFIFSDFNSSSGTSNIDSGRNNYGSDPEMINTGVRELRDSDNNFVGYSTSNVNGGVPGEGVDVNSMFGGMPDPNTFGYGNFLNKYASVSKFEKEDMIMGIIKNASLEEAIAVADGVFEGSGGKIILPIETPIMKISYSKSKDKVFGRSFKYAGSGEMKSKDKELDEDAEDDIKPQIVGAILKAKDSSDDESVGIAPIGKIKIIRITRKVPVELHPVSNGGIEASDSDGNQLSGIIKKIISLFTPQESFGIPGVTGTGAVFSDGNDCCFEGLGSPLTCLMKSEDDNDIDSITPSSSAGKTVVVITKRFMTPPIKIAYMNDGCLVGEIEKCGLKKKVKLSFSDRDETVVNQEKDLAHIALGKEFKIANITKIAKNVLKPVKTAHYDKVVFEDEDGVKEASARVKIKIFFKKNGDGSYDISAHFSDSGKVFMKNVHMRGNGAVKEQLKELGVPAGRATEIANEANSGDSFAMTIDATADSEHSEKIAKFLEVDDSDRFMKHKDIKLIAKVGSMVADTSISDGLKILSTAVVKKEELKDRDDLVEDIKNLSKNLKDYAFFKKCIGNENESKDLFEASSAIENAISDLYYEE